MTLTVDTLRRNHRRILGRLLESHPEGVDGRTLRRMISMQMIAGQWAIADLALLGLVEQCPDGQCWALTGPGVLVAEQHGVEP